MFLTSDVNSYESNENLYLYLYTVMRRRMDSDKFPLILNHVVSLRSGNVFFFFFGRYVLQISTDTSTLFNENMRGFSQPLHANSWIGRGHFLPNSF